LKLAHVEFQVAGKPPVALFGGQRDDGEVNSFGLNGAIDQKPCPIVFVAG
jgi:hypothetical protein